MNKTKPMVRMQSVCGQCIKSSCRGCSNYLGREQEVKQSILTDLIAVIALFSVCILIFII